MTTNQDQEILASQLKHKERSVDDLVRFVETRTAHVSNFSLLFGAGCSVTSGIRSAATLIEEWMRDVFRRLPSNDKVEKPKGDDLDSIRNWLLATQASCYSTKVF